MKLNVKTGKKLALGIKLRVPFDRAEVLTKLMNTEYKKLTLDHSDQYSADIMDFLVVIAEGCNNIEEYTYCLVQILTNNNVVKKEDTRLFN